MTFQQRIIIYKYTVLMDAFNNEPNVSVLTKKLGIYRKTFYNNIKAFKNLPHEPQDIYRINSKHRTI